MYKIGETKGLCIRVLVPQCLFITRLPECSIYKASLNLNIHVLAPVTSVVFNFFLSSSSSSSFLFLSFPFFSFLFFFISFEKNKCLVLSRH